MEGRVDFNALDRSRLLGSLPSGSLSHIFTSGETSTSSSLSRLSAASAAAAAASAGVSPSELSRAGSPSALQQYAGRFMPSGGLHSSGTSYAMMAGHLANTGHIPDSLKHLMPEFQQYWASAAHSEGYARYLLNNIYYPYLPYLPATDTLSFFAQNSANAQVQAAFQAQTAHHRIYDLQKEAIYNSGAVPRSFYPPHLFPQGGQLEATNLSLPSSSKSKQSEREKGKDFEDGRDIDDRKDDGYGERHLHSPEGIVNTDSEKDRHHGGDKGKGKQCHPEKSAKGFVSKTEDKDKIKSSSKSAKTDTHLQNHPNQCNISSTKSIASSTNSRLHGHAESTITVNKEHGETETRAIKDMLDSACRERDRKRGDHSDTSFRSNSMISPTRHERIVSPDRRTMKAYSPVSKKALPSQVPLDISLSPGQFQDVPENLCVKDKKPDKNDIVTSKGCMRTLSIVTGTTITVTSTQNVMTSEYSRIESSLELASDKGCLSPGSQVSPTHNKKATVTTYSLPYYHNLYSKSTEDCKKVHAVTYVPEIGTISSPVAGAPSVINVIDTHHRGRDSSSSQALNLSSSDMRRRYKCTYDSIESEDETEKRKCDRRNEHNSEELDVINIDDDEACDLSKEASAKKRKFTDNNAKADDSTCVQKGKVEIKHRQHVENNSEKTCSLSDKAINSVSGDCVIDVDYLDECEPECVNDTTCSIDTNDKKPARTAASEKSVIQKLHSLDNGTEKGRKHIDKTDQCKSTSKCDKVTDSDRGGSKQACDVNHNSKGKTKSNEHVKVSPKLSLATSSMASLSPTHVSAIDLSKESVTNKRNTNEQVEHKEAKSTALRTPSSRVRDEDKSQFKKQTSPVKPLITRSSVNVMDSESSGKDSPQRSHNVPSPSRTIDSSHKMNVSKHQDSQQQGQSQNIPVGIAVARQRSIAPKVPNTNDKDGGRKATDETKPKSQPSDIKPIRPLKIIRPSTKGTSSSVSDKRNELPANLIVTGGSPGQGMFWSDDPASRQLAAQVIQNSQITPTTWYNPSQFSLPQGLVTPTSEGSQGNQLPITVPPGFKLAQDSLTGQILLIPTGTDVYDASRVFGYPIGTQIHQGSTFVPPGLAGQPTTPSLPTTPTLFPGQHSIGERPATLDFSVPQFPHIYNANVLPGPEVSIKLDKGDHQPQQTTTAVVKPPIIIPRGPESAAVPVNLNEERKNEKDKIQSAIVTDISIAAGQTIPFPSSTVPFTFNSNSLLQSQSLIETNPEVSTLKQEQTTVQSRGTSPMLPATDSSAEDNEDCVTLAEVKSISESEDVIQTHTALETTAVILPSIQNDVKDNVVKSDVKSSDSVTAENCDKVVLDEEVEVKKESKSSEVKREHKSVSDSKTDEQDAISSASFSKIKSAIKSDLNFPLKSATDSEKDCVFSYGSKTLKSDRNIFTDLTDYNPFTDPHVLQAADGLELLSALAAAEKSPLKKPNTSEICKNDTGKSPAVLCESELKDDVYTFKDDHTSLDKKSDKKSALSGLIHEKSKTLLDQNAEPSFTSEKVRSRVRCGRAFKPRRKDAATPTSPSPKRMMTFCGITIPEDDDVIDSIEMEMKMRLAELQRRYREKQRELARLTPKRDKELDKDTDKSVISPEKTPESLKRGPGRPKKRKPDIDESRDIQSGKCSKKEGSHGPSQIGHKSHGLNKKKRMAELLVDRVFRKTGSSFKIPLSKKVNLIAPARIELPSASSSSSTDRPEAVHHNKPIDFGKLIKRSRFSQFGGKERGYVGGFWHKKDEKKKQKHSLFYSTHVKKKKRERGVPQENGLGLLAEYASKTQQSHITATEETIAKRKSTTDIPTIASSPESPNKKRKPGRPKKCEVIRPGITETIVAKQSKHIDFFRWQTGARQDEPIQERKISLEGKTPLKPLYLDEWNVRRSERIFLNDPSPQTSPNALSPDGCKLKVKDDVPENDVKPETVRKREQPKKSRSINLSQKVKRKYSTVITQQRAKYKTEQLKASRDKLSQSRKEQKIKRILSSEPSYTGESDSDNDDVPLSSLRPQRKDLETPTCVIEKDELQDEMRILVFMDGLFHEGELKAIRPPDIYGAILDNERKTRPHYFSQEEILKDAIKDVKPNSASQLKEGTRICAYWSQQFSCLYPGTISRGSPNPDTNKDLLNVEFDDGDTGKIPLDHIRIIPQDFPLVEYDPNPLLFITKRRRTASVSETSEPRKSVSNECPTTPVLQAKDKPKRGPGRPPKAERLLSNESVGEEDVFAAEKKKSSDTTNKTKNDESDDDMEVIAPTSRGLWNWSGSPTKRPGLKGKAKKEYYKTIVRGRESISVGESAVFLSIGRPNLPYVGRIESLWESWGGHMTVKVKWFYHPEETKGGKRLQNMKGALFRSDHEDDNDVQTISHKCEVLPYAEFRRRKDVISLADIDDVYYLAGSYQPTIGHITFEPGVINN